MKSNLAIFSSSAYVLAMTMYKLAVGSLHSLRCCKRLDAQNGVVIFACPKMRNCHEKIDVEMMKFDIVDSEVFDGARAGKLSSRKLRGTWQPRQEANRGELIKRA